MKKILVTPDMIFGYDLGLREGREDVLDAFRQFILSHIPMQDAGERLEGAIIKFLQPPPAGDPEAPVSVSVLPVGKDELSLPENGAEIVLNYINTTVGFGEPFTAKRFYGVLGIRNLKNGRRRRVNAWIKAHPECDFVRTDCNAPKTEDYQSIFLRTRKKLAV